jgi:aldehyde oxidoreductase
MSCKYPVVKALNNRNNNDKRIDSMMNDPHILQLAFAKLGAGQCGFCAPGMIIRTKALLDKHPNPDSEETGSGFRAQIYRCTGCQKIFEAVEPAGSVLRSKKETLSLKKEVGRFVEAPVVLPDAFEKATGTTLCAGTSVDDCAYVKAPGSVHHHCKIMNNMGRIDAEASPGVRAILAGIDVEEMKMAGEDQPALCSDKLRSVGNPVTAVAATSEREVEVVPPKIEVTYGTA